MRAYVMYLRRPPQNITFHPLPILNVRFFLEWWNELASQKVDVPVIRVIFIRG